MYCKNCGEQIPENSKFCFSCGNKVFTDIISQNQNDASPRPGEFSTPEYRENEEVQTVTEAESERIRNCFLKFAIGFIIFLFICSVLNPSENEVEMDTAASANLNSNSVSSIHASVPNTSSIQNDRAKTAALTLSNQIQEMLLASEKITNNLQDCITTYSENKINALQLYEVAKKSKNAQSALVKAIRKLSDENSKDYVSASMDYVINGQITADYLMKYLDKQEMKYVSSMKDNIQLSSTYAIKVEIERIKYLRGQGFSDDEIVENTSPSTSSATNK